MTPEMVTILAATAAMSVALGGLIVGVFVSLRTEMRRMESELKAALRAFETRICADLCAMDIRPNRAIGPADSAAG